MSKKVYIYTLSEDGSDQVKYVGQTISPCTRLIGHFATDGLNESNPKRAWIENVKERNGKIAMTVIDECEIDEAAEREQQWIDHYTGQGVELTNTARVIRTGGRIEKPVQARAPAPLPVEMHSRGPHIQSDENFRLNKIENSLDRISMLVALFAKKTGIDDAAIDDLPLSGSDRVMLALCEKMGIADDAIKSLMKGL